MKELNLTADDVHDAFGSALFVFFIQGTLIFILGLIIVNHQDGFAIILPPTLSVLGARFVCSILMHLQVEGDMRQGLQMMKYVTNHSKDFSNPYYAFSIALMQSLGGLASEISCMIFLCSLADPINVIIRLVAFASIGKVDNFYASALPSEHKLKKDSSALLIKNHRADEELKEDRPAGIAVSRFIYKLMRMLYTSFIFYFLPYLVLFIPQFGATSV